MSEFSSSRLLLEHAQFVRNLARHLLHDEARAEDVTQEAWVVALQASPRDPSRARAWLARIVRNFAFEQRRSDARRHQREARAARPESVPSTEQILEREALRRRVVEAVLALEEPYRSAVLLRFFEDLPPRHIARRLGVPVETVKTRLRRASEKLRVALNAERPDRERRLLGLAGLAGIHFETQPAAATATGASYSLGALIVSTPFKIGSVTALVLAGVALMWSPSTSGPNAADGPRGRSSSGSQFSETMSSAQPVLEKLAVVEPPVAEPTPPTEEADDLSTTGVVQHPDGRSFRMARIERSHGGTWSTNKIQTDSEGRFEIVSQDTGAIDVVAWDPGLTHAPVLIRGITPGTGDLVIRFGAPVQRLRIEVTDLAGQPLERWTATAIRSDKVSLLGAHGASFEGAGLDPVVAAEAAAEAVRRSSISRLNMPLRRRPHSSYPWFAVTTADAESGLLPVPWQLFGIHVNAKGYHTTDLGPFDPTALPDAVRVALEPEPSFGGTVVANGSPVPNASVRVFTEVCRSCVVWKDGHMIGHSHRSCFETTSDGQGRFEIRLGERGRYIARAEADGLAPGDLGPIDLDPTRPTHDLKISLLEPGSIRGRVSLPEHVERESLVITATRGDAFPRKTPIALDGTYRLDGLTPGSWRVEPMERSITQQGTVGPGGIHHASDHAPSEPQRPPFAGNVEVAAGGVTDLDLDVADYLASIRGRLVIGGKPRAGWSVLPAPADRFEQALVPQTTTDGHGAVTFADLRAIRRVLVFERGTETMTRHLEQTIDLSMGDWSEDWTFIVGTLAVVCPSNAEQPWIHWEWTGSGNQRGSGACLVNAETTCTIEDVPAGRVKVWRSNKSLYDPRNPVDGSTAIVEEGQTARLTLQ